MRSSNQTGRTRGVSPSNNAPGILTLTGIGIIVISIILMACFCLSSNAGTNADNPVLLFYNYEEDFPTVSLTNTLNSIGLDYEISGRNYEIDGNREYIIVSFDTNAIESINEYMNESNVLGFILLCPSIEEGASLDGISSSYPDKDIAIFAGSDNADEVSKIGDARILYERLSGDDTVYGVSFKRGGLFASKCYINNNQNRYLSLSAFKYNSGKSMLFSPLFQNELAGYIGVTYQDSIGKDVSFGRINSWFVMMAIGVFAFIFGYALYLSVLPVVSKDSEVKNVTLSERLALILLSGFALIFITLIVVIAINKTYLDYLPVIISFMPIVFMVLMTICKSSLLFVADYRKMKSKVALSRSLFLTASLSLFVVLCSFAFFDMSLKVNVSSTLVVLIAFVFDFMLVYMMGGIDNKSKSKQQGGSIYFGNIYVLPLMLLPSVFAILMGVIFSIQEVLCSGVGGLILVLIPYLCLIPARRHSDSVLLMSLLHSVVYTTLVFVVA